MPDQCDSRMSQICSQGVHLVLFRVIRESSARTGDRRSRKQHKQIWLTVPFYNDRVYFGRARGLAFGFLTGDVSAGSLAKNFLESLMKVSMVGDS